MMFPFASKISMCLLLCVVATNAVPVRKQLVPEEPEYESGLEGIQEATKQFDAASVTPIVSSVLTAAGNALSPALGPLGPVLGNVFGPAITSAGSNLVSDFLNQATSAFTGGVFLSGPSGMGQYNVYAVPVPPPVQVPVPVPNYSSYYVLSNQGAQDSYSNPITPESIDNRYKPAILDEIVVEEQKPIKKPEYTLPAINYQKNPVYAKFPLTDNSLGKNGAAEAKPLLLGQIHFIPIDAGKNFAASPDTAPQQVKGE